MNLISSNILMIVSFLIIGCSNTSVRLLDNEISIYYSQINDNLNIALPITRKMHFGKVKITNATVTPGDTNDTVTVIGSFVLTTFEIPEGISGTQQFEAKLKYVPEDRELFLTDFTPAGTEYAKKSLIEYITKAAKDGTPTVISGELSFISIYKFDSAFKGKKLKRVIAKDDKLELIF